ncbi:DsbA family protein [Cocleimonas sp. KMM 6892]|uniref:DsbA family protein n=1 Tax=unclassified Cocleimonas TaxID=2639732 RepID=UPI002DBBB82A|nr:MULTISPECIES: DsbA family protein [unclassified Cocleimonas]MEB8431238.1 DsbA family protein [Cocleimonas sp. KMM 6892]MEC4713990.1 DsbA family protein [Cocleimonas sp. KMM 6895]MEC4743321.1 DsbA family protein [Cocleimonas sp. KMM 6896]
MSPILVFMILYYVHDPMCSWCWGFSPTWSKIRTQLPDNIEVKYLLGGLAPDSDEPMPEQMQEAIAGYWKRIQQHIPGTKFNFDFWQECEPRRSTYPSCRAVIAARKQKPEIERKMIDAIQKAYYLKAKNPSNDETLIDIAESLGLDKEAFSADLNSAETQQQLEEEMTFARQIGAQGFPSMMLEIEGRYEYLPLDYNDSSKTLELLNQINT